MNGLIGQVEKISVTLSNLSHTYPDDLDILLAAPNGRAMVLMSDAGGSISLSNITLSFEDTGMVLPDNSAISAQTYQPGNFGDADTFPTPAPAPPYLTRLNAFQPSAANGPWHLFVVDDAPGDAGNIRDGWSLTFVTSVGNCCAVPLADLAVSGELTNTSALRVGESFTYSIAITNFGPGIAEHTRATDILPRGFQFEGSTFASYSFSNGVLRRTWANSHQEPDSNSS